MPKKNNTIAGRHLWYVKVRPSQETGLWITTHVRSMTVAIARAEVYLRKNGRKSFIKTVKYRGWIDL